MSLSPIPVIAEVYMDRSIADFVRACEHSIATEQEALAPNNALVTLFLDAILLTRELTLVESHRDALLERLMASRIGPVRVVTDQQTHPLMEELAAIEHARWAHWMRYLLSCCTEAIDGSGDVVIPEEKALRWARQVQTPYAELTEREKDSDRAEVRKSLAILEPFYAADLTRKAQATLHCDYRSTACSHEGRTINGRWVCDTHRQRHA